MLDNIISGYVDTVNAYIKKFRTPSLMPAALWQVSGDSFTNPAMYICTRFSKFLLYFIKPHTHLVLQRSYPRVVHMMVEKMGYYRKFSSCFSTGRPRKVRILILIAVELFAKFFRLVTSTLETKIIINLVTILIFCVGFKKIDYFIYKNNQKL